MTRSQPYLLAWRLEGRRVVIVGGGSIGTAKVETLLDTGADIVVIDPTPSARAVDLAQQQRIRLVERRARPTDMFRCVLVIAATGDSATNRRVRRWAKPFGAVVNAVDDRDNCDVTVPAVIRRGPATIAISTGGASPAGARFLREELTDLVRTAVPERFDTIFEAAGSARRELRDRSTYRYDYAAWKEHFFTPALRAVHDGGDDVDSIRQRFVTAFESSDTPVRAGNVSLVGAGPGGVDLITVRGAAALSKADVVVYDRLADPELLDLASPAAERILVGKGKGFGMSQEEICAVMADRALAGQYVVRLKGGDPFVFGRGAEEAESLAALGLDVDVVPGISSALGGPALAGISLTDRRHSASFTVLTGHRASDGHTDWTALATSGSTLVVLMAATTASRVAADLLDAGRPLDEPVAFVHAAGRPSQQRKNSTLTDVATNGCPFPSPTIMIVGQVTSSDRRPIEQQTILPHELRDPVPSR